MVVDGESKQRP